MAPEKKIRILIVNPNSSHEMTEGIATAISSLPLASVDIITTYTAPSSSPPSINDNEGIQASTQAVLEDENTPKYQEYDATLIACFSVHSLVPKWQQQGAIVTGIFEASIMAVLPILGVNETWGIVTTGKFWEEHLTSGIKGFLGQDHQGANAKFAGVFSTGLTAGDFHHVEPQQVQTKLKEATLQLFRSSKGRVRAVAMGCAGMAGLEEIIRNAAVEHYGAEGAKGLYIIDGVKAGVLQLEQMVRSKREFAIV